VYYLGTDGHLHELWWSGTTWSHNDLTATARNNPVDPLPDSALAGFGLNGNSPRVYYQGTDNHVHELWWSGTFWSHNDLTATAQNNPVPAATGSALTAFAIGSNSPRVYYQGTDSHVHELWYDGTAWHNNDLTATAQNNPTPTATDSALSSFALGGTSPRVYYQSSDGHVHELWWSGSAWSHNDLTIIAHNNPVLAAAGSAISSFSLTGNFPRVYYQGGDNHIHELWYGGSGWSHNDLTATAQNNPAPAATDSAVSSFALEGNSPRVYYQGSDNHIHELCWTGTFWTHNDLSAISH
jgi:REP element-mobilizing transposase RayT